ncbi:MAG TPA: hypothetical protein VMD78_04495 [Candidatus Baltobacteraceae bacterium]|nr:hypothetical protein [Candidatus Baltobacteraceae bacterium]
MTNLDPGAKMELGQIVQTYLAAAGAFGKPVALSALGLSAKEIEDAFGTLDEDYHISRFLHFACSAGANYQINGFPQTHISIDSEIQTIL